MPSDITNLLPLNKMRVFRRGYFFRFGVVCALILSSLVLFGVVLLAPTYLFLNAEIVLREKELAELTVQNGFKDETAFEDRLRTLSIEVARISELDKTPSVSAMLRDVLALAHPGVKLYGFVVAPASSKAGTVEVSGVASTRDSLRAYQLALEAAPFVAAANLPVSAYAKDSDITFSITLMLTTL